MDGNIVPCIYALLSITFPFSLVCSSSSFFLFLNLNFTFRTRQIWLRKWSNSLHTYSCSLGKILILFLFQAETRYSLTELTLQYLVEMELTGMNAFLTCMRYLT